MTEPVRNRPLWQLIASVLIFAVAQEYCLTSESPFSTNGLLWLKFYLWWILALPFLLYFRDKMGERGRGWAAYVVHDRDSLPTSEMRWIAPGVGLAFLIAVLALIERQQPWFFTEDDNLVQFLPVILQGGRSLLHGVFPTWNAYQLLGAPTTSIGVYSLTYPFTYFAYFFSRFLLGNEYLTVEVYSIFHLLAGYFALYWAARCYRVRPTIAASAALCTVLSGWALIASRSWFYVSPIFVYMPLVIGGIAKLNSEKTTWKWIVAMALVIGLFFHAGNVQFWTYGMMFLWIALLVLWWARVLRRNQILASLSASLLGIALASPLLLPQFLQTKNVSRDMDMYLGRIFEQWGAFLVPGPWIHDSKPSDWVDADWKTGGLIVYSGTIFVFLSLLMAGGFLLYRFHRKAIAQNVWLFCGLLSFIALTGKYGVLWPLMLRLPLLGKFRLAFKFIGFFNVFVALSGALVCERLLRRSRWSTQVEVAAVTLTLALLTASCTMYLPSWYTYGIKPYAHADHLLSQLPDTQPATHRMVSLALSRSRSPRYWEAMPHNLPTVYQIPALLGYDPLVDSSPRFLKVKKCLETQLVRALQEYGVEYALIPNDFDHPRLGPYRMAWWLESESPVLRSEVQQLLTRTNLIFQDEEISVLRIPDSKPVVFPESSPNTALPISLAANGFDIETATLPHGGVVIANFFWYPEMHGEANGKPLTITPDAWQRLRIVVPEAAKRVHVQFVPPWWKGILVGAVLAFCGLGTGYFGLKRKPTMTTDAHLAEDELVKM